MIPIYRAKKIDSDEYVEGLLMKSNKGITGYEVFCIQEDNFWREIPIDQNTLAIHFPNMIDKNGKKIFASLSEDGVSGDLITYPYILFDGETKYRKMVATIDDSWDDFSCARHLGFDSPEEFSELEVIGIHKGE